MVVPTVSDFVFGQKLLRRRGNFSIYCRSDSRGLISPANQFNYFRVCD
jgi:hypothetical protein